MRGFGWDLPQWRKEGRLAFVEASPPADAELVIGNFDLNGLLSRIMHAVTTVGARRIVLDSLTQSFEPLHRRPKRLAP